MFADVALWFNALLFRFLHHVVLLSSRVDEVGAGFAFISHVGSWHHFQIGGCFCLRLRRVVTVGWVCILSQFCPSTKSPKLLVTQLSRLSCVLSFDILFRNH